MILDTSAVVAIATQEPQWETLVEIVESEDHLAMSAATAVELAAVLARSAKPEQQRRVNALLEAWGVEIVSFDASQAALASQAYRDFGRGSGHAAKLNMGDCYSYALAISRGEPLLYVGDDFSHTDVEQGTSRTRAE